MALGSCITVGRTLDVRTIGTPLHLFFGCLFLLSSTRPLPSKKSLAVTYLSLGLKNLSRAPSSIVMKDGAIFPCEYLQSNLPRVYAYVAHLKNFPSLLKNSVFPEFAVPCTQTALTFCSLLRIRLSQILSMNSPCWDLSIIFLISSKGFLLPWIVETYFLSWTAKSGSSYCEAIKSSKKSAQVSNLSFYMPASISSFILLELESRAK